MRFKPSTLPLVTASVTRGLVAYLVGVTTLFKLSAILTILWARLFLGEGQIKRSHRNCQAPCGAKIKTEQARGKTTPSCTLEDEPEAPENRLSGEGWGQQANRSG